MPRGLGNGKGMSKMEVKEGIEMCPHCVTGKLVHYLYGIVRQSLDD